MLSIPLSKGQITTDEARVLSGAPFPPSNAQSLGSLKHKQLDRKVTTVMPLYMHPHSLGAPKHAQSMHTLQAFFLL